MYKLSVLTHYIVLYWMSDVWKHKVLVICSPAVYSLVNVFK